MKRFNTCLIVLFLSINSFAQMSGNQVYGNRYYNNNNNSSARNASHSVVTTDTTIAITSKVLLQLEPDYYLVTIGASEVAETVKKCNENINKRINGLIRDLKKLDVQKEAYYVDFIAQTVLYDYEIEGQQASQFQKGFEIKKNIIIRLNELSQFDKLIEMCALQNMYDIIKIDYRNNDINAIHDQLYKEAMTIIQARKKLYLDAEATNFKKSRILTDRMYTIFPKSQYKQYQAFETSEVYTNYNSSYIKKQARKRNTFYYDGIDLSGFDKVINGDSPVVGVQYVIELSVFFEKE